MPNEVKYLENGTEVEVLEKTSRGFIVLTVYREDDDSIYLGHDQRFVERVYDEPPTAKLSEKVERLTGQINRLELELRQAEEKTSWAKLLQHETLTKLKAYEPLKRIEDFIDGKITHLVVGGEYGPPKIKLLSECHDEYDHTKLKLLVLYGASSKQLDWCLHHYSDGSGHGEWTRPCCSLEEAEAKCVQIITERISEYPKKNLQAAWIKAADKFGVHVPQEARDAIRNEQIAKAREVLAEREKQVEEAKEKLSAILAEETTSCD